MDNQQQKGKCKYCGEESDRLFNLPLINPPDWDQVLLIGIDAHWRCSDQAIRGANIYDIITIDENRYLKPYETPDEPICWQCFAGHVNPCELEHVVNRPADIIFNGYAAPTWKGK